MHLAEVVRLRDASNQAHAAYHASIVAAHESGHSIRSIAEAVGVSHGTIHTIITRHRQRG